MEFAQQLSSLSSLYDILPARKNVVHSKSYIPVLNRLQREIDLLNDSRRWEGTLGEGSSDLNAATNQGLQQSHQRGDSISESIAEFEPGKQYPTVDFHGKPIAMTLPDVEKGQVYYLKVLAYHEIAQALVEQKQVALYTVAVVDPEFIPHKEDDVKICFNLYPKNGDDTTPYKYWYEIWKDIETDKVWTKTLTNGRHGFKDIVELTKEERDATQRLRECWRNKKEKLKKIIWKHGDKLKRVDKIVCFGLGSLSTRKPKYFVQHLAAVTLREEIELIRKKDDECSKHPAVQIIAQDPAYCSNCKDILKSLLNIEAVDTFEGHDSLTRTTTTMSVSPSAPVCQMIADLTVDFGGPLAMICDDFHLDIMEVRDVKDIDDQPTKNMVGYKTKSITEDLDDAVEMLKMTREEYIRRYKGETPIYLVQKWLKAGKNVGGLGRRGLMSGETLEWWMKKSKTDGKELSEEEVEEYAKWEEAHEANTLVYFSEVRMFIRRD
jgi:hypothetical protein